MSKVEPESKIFKARLRRTSTGKLILYIHLDEFDRKDFLLEKGKIPSALFQETIQVIICEKVSNKIWERWIPKRTRGEIGCS
jgi:hypothetical protein